MRRGLGEGLAVGTANGHGARSNALWGKGRRRYALLLATAVTRVI